MIRLTTLAFSAFGILFATNSLHAQDLSRYREFALGSPLATVTSATGVAAAEAKTIHQRPALIQELRWRPERYSGGEADPVREIIFSFYNDRLYLIAVDYDRQRTDGLTDADLIEAMTLQYGPPVLTATALTTRPGLDELEHDTVVARWADADSSLTLLRGPSPTNLRLVIALKRIEAQARTASAKAVRKDDLEAPQRASDRQTQQADDRRTTEAKAKVANKLAFRP